MEEEGEEKSGEKGKENAGTKEEEEGKATGKRGNSTGKVAAPRRTVVSLSHFWKVAVGMSLSPDGMTTSSTLLS